MKSSQWWKGPSKIWTFLSLDIRILWIFRISTNMLVWSPVFLPSLMMNPRWHWNLEFDLLNFHYGFLANFLPGDIRISNYKWPIISWKFRSRSQICFALISAIVKLNSDSLSWNITSILLVYFPHFLSVEIVIMLQEPL